MQRFERAKPTTYKAGWYDAVDSIPGPGVAVILVLCVLFDQNATHACLFHKAPTVLASVL